MNKAESKNIFDIVIIGGGASGVMAAVSASRFCKKKNIPVRIAIIERHAKLGRKLLATGNGRCNLSNWNASVHASNHYYSEYPLLYEAVLGQFTPQKTVEFFQSIGILCQTKDDGKVYPFCDQAFSVVEMLSKELASLDIEIITNMEVQEINKEASGFNLKCKKIQLPINAISIVETTPVHIHARRVIVATGGKASPALSSDGLGYKLLAPLSHKCTYMFPAIVQIKTQTDFVSTLVGTKCNVGISLMRTTLQKAQEEKSVREILKKDSGELLFTKYGISGPPVLQIARHLNGFEQEDKMDSKMQYYAVIDYLENFTTKDVVDLLTKRIIDFKDRPIHQLLIGIMPFKIAIAITKRVFLQKENHLISTITPKELALLVTQLKTFTIRITGTTGWNEAQVTAGGIRCDQVSPQTLESNLCEGLYIIGEVLDVDGDCGGYNLQFAWASGYAAGVDAAKLLVETTTD